MKILAVDDDKTALGLLQEALSAAGYTDVTTSPDAASALERLLDGHTQYDVLMYDIQMPGMSGIDLVRETRALEDYKRTPILMVTAMSEKEYVDDAFAAGATDYLTKPFDPLEVGVRVGLAAELSNEYKSLLESTDVIEALVRELDKVTRHRLDAPIELGHVDRLLTYPAFENYLFELSRGVFFLSSLFAVKVRDADRMHAKLPPLEFKQILTRAAKAIAGPLAEYNVFLAYRGNGIFVGALQRAGGAQALKRIGTELKLDLSDEKNEMPPEAPDHISLIFGDPVVSKVFSRPGSMRNMRAAIDNVETKLKAIGAPKDPVVITGERIHHADRMNEIRREKELREEFEALLKQALDRDSVSRFPDLVDPRPGTAKKKRKPA